MKVGYLHPMEELQSVFRLAVLAILEMDSELPNSRPRLVDCNTNAIGDRIHGQTLVDMVRNESVRFPRIGGYRSARQSVVGRLNSCTFANAKCRLSDIECRLQNFSLGSRVIRTLGGGCSCRDKLPNLEPDLILDLAFLNLAQIEITRKRDDAK